MLRSSQRDNRFYLYKAFLTECLFSFARRRRLPRIVRNSLWLFLTRYATPPFPQKSRSARLLGCKRPPDGSLSLPTFADFGQGQALSLRHSIIFNPCKAPIILHSSFFILHYSFFTRPQGAVSGGRAFTTEQANRA